MDNKVQCSVDKSDRNRRYSQRNLKHKNYREEEIIPDDRYIYCDDCFKERLDYCKIHGNFIIINDTPIPKHPYDKERARKTAPEGWVTIKPSKISGEGVWSLRYIPEYVRFGPYEGIVTEIKSEQGYAWELRNNGRKDKCVDAVDPGYSNWMRYVNCSRNREEQNLMAFQYCGQLYYRTVKPIEPHTELLVWYGVNFATQLGINCKMYNIPLYKPLPDNKFECKYCFIIFNDPINLDKHVERCHITENITKDIALLTTGELNKSTSNSCDICQKSFAKMVSVTNHIVKAHKVKKVHKCQICKHTFGDISNYKKHVSLHEEEKYFRNKLTETTEINTNDTNSQLCEICAEVFENTLSFENHQKTHHEENLNKNQKFQFIYNEIKMNIEMNNLKIFDGSNELDWQKISLGNDNFNQIKKEVIAFSQVDTKVNTNNIKMTDISNIENKNYLKRKMKKSFLSNTLYSCNLCHKTFANNFSVNRHKRAIHRNNNFICILCSKTYKYNHNLRRHIKLKHNKKHRMVTENRSQENIKYNYDITKYDIDKREYEKYYGDNQECGTSTGTNIENNNDTQSRTEGTNKNNKNERLKYEVENKNFDLVDNKKTRYIVQTNMNENELINNKSDDNILVLDDKLKNDNSINNSNQNNVVSYVDKKEFDYEHKKYTSVRNLVKHKGYENTESNHNKNLDKINDISKSENKENYIKNINYLINFEINNNVNSIHSNGNNKKCYQDSTVSIIYTTKNTKNENCNSQILINKINEKENDTNNNDNDLVLNEVNSNELTENHEDTILDSRYHDVSSININKSQNPPSDNTKISNPLNSNNLQDIKLTINKLWNKNIATKLKPYVFNYNHNFYENSKEFHENFRNQIKIKFKNIYYNSVMDTLDNSPKDFSTELLSKKNESKIIEVDQKQIIRNNDIEPPKKRIKLMDVSDTNLMKEIQIDENNTARPKVITTDDNKDINNTQNFQQGFKKYVINKMKSNQPPKKPIINIINIEDNVKINQRGNCELSDKKSTDDVMKNSVCNKNILLDISNQNNFRKMNSEIENNQRKLILNESSNQPELQNSTSKGSKQKTQEISTYLNELNIENKEFTNPSCNDVNDTKVKKEMFQSNLETINTNNICDSSTYINSKRNSIFNFLNCVLQ